MQQTQALAEPTSFASGERATNAPDTDQSPPRHTVWRGRIAVGALVGVSALGYALALIAIDTVVHGQLPTVF